MWEKKKVILFELKLEQELLELEQQLKNGTYKHGGYTKFKIYEPKERIIMASEYKDRVVHQWYVENFIKPYFVSQFMATSYAGIEGRGGWTWYTGSASWMYEAGLKYILGLRIQNITLHMEPCIPNDWKEYTIRYQYGKSIYHIRVSNQNGKMSGVTSFKVNGKDVPDKKIVLNKNGGVYNIDVEM